MATRKTANTAKKVTPAKKVTKTAAKAKAVSAKAKAHQKENRQEMKSLKVQQECQEMIGASRKDTKARLKELRDAQAAIKAEAKALREAVSAEKSQTAEARKELAAGKKAVRSSWATVRSTMTVFRNALKSETDNDAMANITADLCEALEMLANEARDVGGAKQEILKIANGLVDENELGDDEEL